VSLRDKFFADDDPDPAFEDVPTRFGVVRVCAMTTDEFSRYLDLVQEATERARKPDGTLDDERLERVGVGAMLVMACRDPETGGRVFLPEDAARITGRHFRDYAALYQKAEQLNKGADPKKPPPAPGEPSSGGWQDGSA
jgi:hypothetical protein